MQLNQRIRKLYGDDFFDRVAQRLSRAVHVAADGAPLQYNAFNFEQTVSVLESAIEFSTDIPEPDRVQVVRDAMLKALHAVEAGSDRSLAMVGGLLEKEIKASESRYLAKPVQEYVLCTSLNIFPNPGAKKWDLTDASFRFCATLPKRYDRDPVQYLIDKNVPPSLATGFTCVICNVKARTPISAYEKARNSIDLMRAFWNYRLSPAFVWSNGERRPVNAIVPGPIHTVHCPSGQLAFEEFWFEAEPIQASWRFDPRAWKEAMAIALKLQRRLRCISYRADLENAFVRYVRALDFLDHRTAFTKLWGVLESLVGTGGNKYETIVSRVSFLIAPEERPFGTLLVEHLRDVRNGLIHDDLDRLRIQTYLCQLKLFVEVLFRFHLREGRRYSSIRQACEFLDITPDEVVLRRRILDYNRAIKTWGGEKG